MSTETPRLTPKGQATRQRILAAAAEVFARQGYEKTRVADIAEGAGVSHGNFYRHFTDKDDVLDAVLQAPLAELRGATSRRRAADAPEPGGLQDLVNQSTAYFRAYARHASLLRVMREASARGSEASFFSLWLDERQRFVARTERWLEGLGPACSVPAAERRLLAESLGAMTEQMAFVQIALAPQPPDEDRLQALGRCCGRIWYLAVHATVEQTQPTAAAR